MGGLGRILALARAADFVIARRLVAFEIWIISGEQEALQAIRFGQNLAWNLLASCFEAICKAVYDIHNFSMYQRIFLGFSNVVPNSLDEGLKLPHRVVVLGGSGKRKE